MGRYEELFGIGEGEAFIGNEELPLPKYIAPIVKGATFGLLDDTSFYDYKELTPAIEEGYLPTLGGEVTIQDVPFKAITTSDLIEGIAGELTGDLIAGGLGKLLGSLVRPLRRVIKQVIEEVERVPIKTLKGGYKVFKDPLPEGGSFYRIVSPDNKGAITVRDSFSDIPDYLTINTIGVDPTARGGKLGKNYKHDAYNAAVEWAHELGKKGIASAKQLRTSSIADRFWFDFGEGSIVDPSRNLTYDFLHTKTIPPLRPSEFKIVEAGVNPMVTSNKLMEEGAAGVIPLRRLVGKDRYGTLRPGQSDRIRAFAVLDEVNITKKPKDLEGLVDITVRPNKGQPKPEKRGFLVRADSDVALTEIPSIEEVYKRFDPDTGELRGNRRWGFVEPSNDPRIDEASWGVALDYEGYVESGGKQFKAIIEPVSVVDTPKGSGFLTGTKDPGYYRLSLANGTRKDFSTIEDAIAWVEKGRK